LEKVFRKDNEREGGQKTKEEKKIFLKPTPQPILGCLKRACKGKKLQCKKGDLQSRVPSFSHFLRT